MVSNAHDDSLGLTFEDVGVSPEERILFFRLHDNSFGDSIFSIRVINISRVLLVASHGLADFEVSRLVDNDAIGGNFATFSKDDHVTYLEVPHVDCLDSSFLSAEDREVIIFDFRL